MAIRRLLREVALIAGVMLLYEYGRIGLGDRAVLAFYHASDIMKLEKEVGIFIEKQVQDLFLRSDLLITLANGVYTFFYYPVLAVAAIWLYVKYPHRWVFVRNVFIISAVISFTVFILYPVAPPRYFSYLGFVDTMANFGRISYDSTGLHKAYNPYAAVPSMHFAWTLLASGAIFFIAKNRMLKTAGALVPPFMLLSIVATGNHFLLDAVAGLLLIALALGLAWMFRRPNSRLFPQRLCLQEPGIEMISSAEGEGQPVDSAWLVTSARIHH
ncbi:MAG: phosphatase PAP2 family protein [Chloroflexi bacterium]|nr:phosphatase PAP2 family protein [Chloroflexota bacterium]